MYCSPTPSFLGIVPSPLQGKGVVYGEETTPRYEYDYNAKGQVARVRDNLLNRTTQSEYDLANRPVRVKIAEVGQHVYTGQVAYDNVYGNLSEFTEKVGENRQEFGTKFGFVGSF